MTTEIVGLCLGFLNLNLSYVTIQQNYECLTKKLLENNFGI